MLDKGIAQTPGSSLTETGTTSLESTAIGRWR